MRRPSSRARWAALALALTVTAVVAPALADRKKKPVAKKRTPVSQCARFDQVERGDDAVDLLLDNGCDVRLSCSVSWKLVCSPGTARAKRTDQASVFALAVGAAQATTASASTCGDEGWVIDDVIWACRPDPAPTAQP